MTTLITVGNSEGHLRCDAKCHNAQDTKCRCICGGRYHGAANKPGGIEKAIEDTTEEFCQGLKTKGTPEALDLLQKIRQIQEQRRQADLFTQKGEQP